MKLLKKYKDEPGKKPEKEFETTLEEELIHLAKTFIDPKSIVDLLKEGKTFTTPWATYRMKEEKPAKQRIEKEIIRVMSKSINKEANEDNYLYYRGFVNGCKFFKIIDTAEGIELNAYLVELFTENRKKLEGRKK